MQQKRLYFPLLIVLLSLASLVVDNPFAEQPLLPSYSDQMANTDVVRSALARHDGNVVAAADELGLSRSALYRRMEKYGL